jgi:parallel beta-helix repeat protein
MGRVRVRARGERTAAVAAPLRNVLAAAAIAAALMLAGGSSSATAATCDKVASPVGFDFNPGTTAAPYRTAGKLARSLSRGQTGCFRAGTYHFPPYPGGGEELKLARPGITLRSYPGERAKLVGRLWVARTADAVTISHLDLDGSTTRCPGGTIRCLASPTVNATDTTFNRVTATNGHRTICFLLGVSGWGRAFHTVIEHSRIHGCGELPANNMEHGIYVGRATGTVIRDNEIYDNADRGIQLYPDAQRTRIVGNVIDGNGTGIRISGAYGVASSRLQARGNVVTNSGEFNVNSWWPSGNPVGTRNRVTHNCTWRAYGKDIDGIGPRVGFRTNRNLAIDPRYADRGARDFRLQAGSPCLELGAVSLRLDRTTVHVGGRVGVSGRADAGSPTAWLLAGTPTWNPRVALIQRRGSTGWRTIGRLRLASGRRFHGHATIRPRGRRHHLELRARVAGTGRSAAARIRVAYG